MPRAIFIIICMLMLVPVGVSAQSARPRLVLTAEDITAVRQHRDSYPLLASSYATARQRVENALRSLMDVPQPVDAGGYTHEKHKQNYTDMYYAGILFQVTGEERYATFVRQMLLKYAALYPTLKKHPLASSNSPGRLFWQTLNETVWLTHIAQAYDCVYDAIPPADRKKIEAGVLRPLSAYFTGEMAWHNDQMHNHGTWSCAAVGLLGFALRDTSLITQALYGTKKDGSGGFLRQLHELFSPDGYYTEGPYYIRYALQPFFLLAEAIENNRPELKIYEQRDRILQKAVTSAMSMTYTNGMFIPINDALKEKTYAAAELIPATNIAYKRFGGGRNILGIAMRQGAVMLSEAGAAIARDAAKETGLPAVEWPSVAYRDGARGDEGGVAALRFGSFDDQAMLVFKYTGHGLSHGHYDKLTYLFFDQNREIVQDYGAVRFINIEPKNGGRYLPENKSWAVQTIAHNTLVVDGKSHFEGKQEVSERHHSELLYISMSDSTLQVVSAAETNAYPGVAMQRTMALAKIPELRKPFVIDVFRVASSSTHQYDLPLYYLGHFMNTNVKYTPHATAMKALGNSNGYQHLWLEAAGTATGPVQFTWLNGKQFYSAITAADSATRVLFVRIGAGDPNFNLRHDAGVILRRVAADNVFATVIESHGLFDGSVEVTEGASPNVQSVLIAHQTAAATAVEISGKGFAYLFMSATANEPEKEHRILHHGREYRWKGNYALQRLN